MLPNCSKNIPTQRRCSARCWETSTGVGHDIEAIGRVVGPSKALLVVDGISGAGVMECRTDAWGIDVLAVGSQKALMTAARLGLSDR